MAGKKRRKSSGRSRGRTRMGSSAEKTLRDALPPSAYKHMQSKRVMS